MLKLRNRLRYLLLLAVVCVPVSQALADEDWIDASQGTISGGVFTARNTAIGATLTITNVSHTYSSSNLNYLQMRNQEAETTIKFKFEGKYCKSYSIQKFWCNAYYKKKKKALFITTTVSERVYPAGKDGDQFSTTVDNNSVTYTCTGKFDHIFLNAVYLNYNVDAEVADNAPAKVSKQYTGSDQILFKNSNTANESAYSYSTYVNSSFKPKYGGNIYFWFEGTGLTSDKGLAKNKGTYTMKWKYNVGSYSGYKFDSFVYSKGGGIMYLKSNKFNVWQESTFTSKIYGLQMTDVTPPTAKELFYTGEPQTLVEAGTSSNGKAMYWVSGNAGWSDTIPAKTDAGTYKVYWYIQSTNGAYDDYGGMSDANRKGPVEVTIKKAAIPVHTPPSGLTLSYNTAEQRLINAGSATGGTPYYRLGTDGTWTTSIDDIKRVSVGTYDIYYYYKGDNNHSDLGSETEPVGSVQAQIVASDYNMANVKWSGSATVVYDGSDHKNALAIDGNTLSPEIGVTYTYAQNNAAVTKAVNAGTYTVTAHFTTTSTNYAAPADMSTTLTITPFNLKDAVASAQIPDQTYTSVAVEPVTAENTVLKLKVGGATIPATAYTATYLNNVNAGTATATLTANGTDGNYMGSATVNFNIVPKVVKVQTNAQTIEYGSSLSNTLPTNATLLDACTDHALSAVTLKVVDGITLQIGANENAIVAVTDETFIKDASGNDVTANYTITCPTECRGTLSVTAKSGDGFTVLGLKDEYEDEYEGDGVHAVVPTGVTVYDGSTPLTPGTDYNVTYSNNTSAGTATATFAMTGCYTGSITKQFTIYYTATTYSRKSAPSYNYCTYYHPTEKLQAKGDAEVYFCTLINDNKDVLLTKETNGIINAGVPVMLRTPAETTTVKLYKYDGADATYSGTNALKGVTTGENGLAGNSIASDDKIYIFDGESFVWATGGNYTAHRAYIDGSADSGHPLSAPRLSIVIAGEGTTGINSVEAVSDGMEGVWYDLQGRKLSAKPTRKGLYILNGKTVVVK